jgi:exodeoxyribonuclease VII small subunit
VSKPASSPKSYQELNDSLKEIIDWFEDGDLTIDDALPKYEEAIAIIKEMEKYLDSAENKIKKIKSTLK